MNNGYYIFPCGYEGTTKEYAGVLKKIEMQCQEFSKYYDMEYVPIYEKTLHGMFKKIQKRMPWSSAKRDYSSVIKRIKSPEFLYIRRTTADSAFIGFLSTIKKEYPKCKIVIEIYTYPYEKDEYHGIVNKLYIFKDRYFRKKYKNLVDRFVTFSNDEEIFGVKTIICMNGIDVSAQQMVIHNETNHNDLNIIFVGFMQRQHGLERAIIGMHEYYSKREENKKNIVLHVVGEGPELNLYQELVKKYDLSANVFFYGKRYGVELDKIYDNCNVGISALGLYKNDVSISSALKSREYIAKGIPVISGNPTDVFEKYPCDFHIDFPNDPSPIDMNQVIQWYEKILHRYGSLEKLSNEIRTYAFLHLDNSVAMKPIIEYLSQSGSDVLNDEMRKKKI